MDKGHDKIKLAEGVKW